jgi:hypothetical protein
MGRGAAGAACPAAPQRGTTSAAVGAGELLGRYALNPSGRLLRDAGPRMRPLIACCCCAPTTRALPGPASAGAARLAPPLCPPPSPAGAHPRAAVPARVSTVPECKLICWQTTVEREHGAQPRTVRGVTGPRLRILNLARRSRLDLGKEAAQSTHHVTCHVTSDGGPAPGCASPSSAGRASFNCSWAAEHGPDMCGREPENRARRTVGGGSMADACFWRSPRAGVLIIASSIQ